jgi:hypothetical protein
MRRAVAWIFSQVVFEICGLFRKPREIAARESPSSAAISPIVMREGGGESIGNENFFYDFGLAAWLELPSN